MLTAKISAKGQINLPKSVREALGLGAGDRVAFVVEGASATIIPMPSRTADDLCGSLAHLAADFDLEELRLRRAEDLSARLLGPDIRG